MAFLYSSKLTSHTYSLSILLYLHTPLVPTTLPSPHTWTLEPESRVPENDQSCERSVWNGLMFWPFLWWREYKYVHVCTFQCFWQSLTSLISNPVCIHHLDGPYPITFGCLHPLNGFYLSHPLSPYVGAVWNTENFREKGIDTYDCRVRGW